MEQVQQSKSETKRKTRSNWVFVGLLIAFIIIAGVAAYLTYTNVKDFVAAWNITDLPGIVVDPDSAATQIAPEIVPGVENPPPPALAIGPEPVPWDGASRVNILVMGLDYRDWIIGEGAPRTDTMVLASVGGLSCERVTIHSLYSTESAHPVKGFCSGSRQDRVQP